MHSTEKIRTRVYIICPELKMAPGNRDSAEKLEEAKGLARAIDLDIIEAETIKLQKISAGLLLGKGSLERIKQYIESDDIMLVFVDYALSPIQQRNLEEFWGAKVIDRTGIILEIFGERAQTHEGRLQVEFARLMYQRSRIVRSWTHLERQRGGTGSTGGPGEMQRELDRRMLDTRIQTIKKELESVKRTRSLQRQSRQKIPYPVIALVGYTNAGKSTLFNRLTGAEVLEKDMLFATLDPTLRLIKLPSGQKVILSDTVGFIADLPTHLVAAFRATLEEVMDATLILHVRDYASPETEAQRSDVLDVLKTLDIEDDVIHESIEVLNKIDLMTEEQLQKLKHLDENEIAISAMAETGLDALLVKIDEALLAKSIASELKLNYEEGEKLAWLYAHAFIEERIDGEKGITLKVRFTPKNKAQFDQKF